MRHFTGEEFEEEVRRIARALYANSTGQGSESIGGRERDGVFWNGNFFTIVEATTEKKMEKAEYDAKKTHELVTKKRSEGFMAHGLLVTLYEPTPDQKLAVKKYQKTTKVISFDELRSLVFDTAHYLRNRGRKAFGSVFDHATHSFEVPRSEFVEPTISTVDSAKIESLKAIVAKARESKRLVITAEYGIGKSMLLREIFFLLLKEYEQKSTFRFPVAINLREHMGQDNPVELLERHARNTASDPQKLVAAWIAGYVDLIIDGFDELSTRGWTGDHRKLREFKRSTHLVVKNLIKQTPKNSSIIISGRAAYFDSDNEMREALGVPEGVFEHLIVQPFDSQQASTFLKKKGFNDKLPQWLPTRPLFLNYLINKNLIQEAVAVSSFGSFPEGAAWSALLQMIAGRESEQSEGVDKDSILQFWGLLATKARQGNALQKSFSPTEMDEAFYLATGNSVTEDERLLLLRLPGLGISPDNPSSRIFIDGDFLNAASASLVFSHIKTPHGDEAYKLDLRNVTEQLSHVGAHVICANFEQEGLSTGLLDAALVKELSDENFELAFDLFVPLIYLGQPKGHLVFKGIDIEEIDICQDIWDPISVGFTDCLISSIVLPPEGDLPAGLNFKNCLIGNIDGRTSVQDLPSTSFSNCEIGKFKSSFSVNNDILGSELPIGIRVLIVTLRKVYVQAGISRLESALLRGLDHRARMIAPDVIQSLLKHGFLVESGRQGKTIYAGTSAMRKEAIAIIQSPASYKSAILQECKALS